jgi:hypothetical protein
MNPTRRLFIATTGLGIPAFGLVGCGTNAAAIDAQVLADAQGLVTVAGTITTAIEQYDPKAFSADVTSQIAQWEAAAKAGLATLSTSTPAATGASKLQVVETDINNVLQAVRAVLPIAAAAVPAIAPFVPMYDAAVALLPIVEAYVNSVVAPSAVSARVALKPVGAAFSPEQARKVLGVPSVK